MMCCRICRREPAREEREGDALIQAARVIVSAYGKQARFCMD